MTSLTKKLESHFFFISESFEGLHNPLRSYAVGKVTVNCWFSANLKVQIYCTLTAKVLMNTIYK